ncbi:MAG: Integrin alpha beta-propellor repeat protein [Nitrospira sp.]|nr:MAG: Integrin alpha beta-propellor repeat protein [Nitrospira sp.]
MNQDGLTLVKSAAICRNLFLCGLLFGLVGCPENDSSAPVLVEMSTLSASLIQQAYVKASNTGATDKFGGSAALDGDTLVVGAYQEDSSRVTVTRPDESVPDSGAVYVFTRTNGDWSQQAYLKASNARVGDHFGTALTLSGDTLAVGAPREDSSGVNGDQADNSAPDSGAVYVYTRTNGTWAQQAYLKASNAGMGDFFGSALALNGDTLAVGAPQEDSAATGVNGNQVDSSASNSGAVYVYTRTNGTWAQQAYLKASNTTSFNRFGNALTLSGDTLAVGAPQEDSASTGVNGNQDQGDVNSQATNSGAAYVFTRTNGSWTQQAYLKASNTGLADYFGTALVLSGDTLVVGAKGEGSEATGVNGDQISDDAAGSGAAYVFTRTNGSWAQQAYLKASNTDPVDGFGNSLALSGDTLVVGAAWEDSATTGINGDQLNDGAQESGAVYVFTRTGGSWAQQAYLKASNTGASDGFGTALALSGDTLAVGASGESSVAAGINGDQLNNGALESGAVYVFQ